MYEDLIFALNMCANNPACENCPWIGDTECTANLMIAAIAAIQQLQGSSSRKIDFDVDPDEFMKMLGATECRNGTEYIEMFCMGYEDNVFAVDIKNKHDLALLKMYFEKYSGKAYGEAFKDDYIGKRIVVNFWDESCNVVGTREEMESKFKSYLDRLFGSETEGTSE